MPLIVKNDRFYAKLFVLFPCFFSWRGAPDRRKVDSHTGGEAAKMGQSPSAQQGMGQGKWTLNCWLINDKA